MEMFEIVAGLLSLAAIFSFLNYHFFRLPTTIGLMLYSLLLSLAIIVVGVFNPVLKAKIVESVASIDFDEAVLHGMLGFLLFAGAMHINLNDLTRHWVIIGLLITIGVVISTLVGRSDDIWCLCDARTGSPLHLLSVVRSIDLTDRPDRCPGTPSPDGRTARPRGPDRRRIAL